MSDKSGNGPSSNNGLGLGRKMNLLYKRGTKAQNDNYTGKPGEITLDTTSSNLRIHDGETPGGRVLKAGDFDQASIENMIEGALYLHANSGDHDGRYHKKEYLDQLLQGVINNLEGKIHAQDVIRYVEGEQGEEFGWCDNVSDIEVRGQGNANPAWASFRSGIRAYRFESSRMNECWSSFHIDHDYAMNTPLYPHMHWAPEDDRTGTVRWGFEYTIAKGHAQGEDSVFPPSSIVYAETEITQASSHMHFITETSDAAAIPPDLAEPDSLIIIRFFRDATNDTYPGGVFGLKTDIHYQAARFATINKEPNFFGEDD